MLTLVGCVGQKPCAQHYAYTSHLFTAYGTPARAKLFTLVLQVPCWLLAALVSGRGVPYSLNTLHIIQDFICSRALLSGIALLRTVHWLQTELLVKCAKLVYLVTFSAYLTLYTGYHGYWISTSSMCCPWHL